ncbi:hypothetical protein FHP05_00520 [Cerasibacillus terrae]|uniref:Permease n=2 Tax=Cerasibacillus terrae TaxID=2498845 RepID=A0A5C8P2N0_9BACI|nr:hypothetical protein FHP05_00520 [Cerasibacillus terrae]
MKRREKAMTVLMVTFIGLNENDILYIFVFLGILGSYFSVKPLISFMMALKLEKLLNYILGSLLFFTLYFGIALWKDEWQLIIYDQLQFTLQAVALFGGVLFTVYLVKGIRKN